MSEPEPLHRQLGLSDDELESVVQTLGRDPNRSELAMYAAMWSEHCSYKSSRIHLRTLPTEGPAVLVGPGQDAGAHRAAGLHGRLLQPQPPAALRPVRRG